MKLSIRDKKSGDTYSWEIPGKTETLADVKAILEDPKKNCYIPGYKTILKVVDQKLEADKQLDDIEGPIEVNEFYKDVTRSFKRLILQEEDKKIHVLYTAPGLGKSHSIKEGIVETINDGEEKGFAVFLPSHDLMDEYESDLIDMGVASDKIYHHKGIDKGCKYFDKIIAPRAIGRATNRSVYCDKCDQKPTCPYLKLPRLNEKADKQIILLSYHQFDKMLSTPCKYKDSARVGIIEEGYVERFVRPDEGVEREALINCINSLRDYCEDKGISFPTHVDSLQSSITKVQNTTKHYRRPAIKTDFEYPKEFSKAAADFFKTDTTNTPNYLDRIKSGIRYGFLTGNYPHPKDKPKFTFKPIANQSTMKFSKIIIADGTYDETRHTEYLNARFHTEVKVYKLRPKMDTLTVKHNNAFSFSKGEYLKRTKDDQYKDADACIDDFIDRVDKTKEMVLLADKEHIKAYEELLKSKGYTGQIHSFHFGDNLGSNKGRNAETILKIGKHTLPPIVVQSNHLNSSDIDFSYGGPGINFEDDTFNDLSSKMTAMDSIQGICRARPYDKEVTVYDYSKEDYKSSEWEQFLPTENYSVMEDSVKRDKPETDFDRLIGGLEEVLRDRESIPRIEFHQHMAKMYDSETQRWSDAARDKPKLREAGFVVTETSPKCYKKDDSL